MKKAVKKKFSPKKLALMTDIIVTIMRARIIFLDACNLLLTSPGAGEIEDFNGNTTIKGRLASLFFYSHSELYTEFVKNIFYKYMQKKANILSNLTETTVGILAKRERDPSLTIPNYVQNGVFFFGGEKFQEQDFSFILHDKKTKGIRRLEVGVCRDFFKDFHSARYDDETYDPEGLQIDYLEGMGTLFNIFTTSNISNIYVTKELEAFRNRKSSLFKEGTSGEGEESLNFVREEVFKSEALSSLREMVLDIKKAFSEKEELTKPEVFVDKEIIEISVKAAANTKNLNFLSKAKGWKDANLLKGLGILAAVNPQTAKWREVYLLKGLPQTVEFNAGLKKMDERYLFRKEYKTTNTVLPGFVAGFSLQTKKIKSSKIMELSFHQAGYILVNTKNKGEKRFKEGAYRDRDWVKKEEEIEDDNFGFLANVAMFTAFLRELDLSTLEKLKKEIVLAEKGATTIYRFFAATKNLCKIQLLLKNI